jgi:KipI family sensor histidine kinase inhibitor
MNVRPVGAGALLVEVGGLDEMRSLYGELLRRRADGRLPAVTDIVPGERTVLLDGVADQRALARDLSGWSVPVSVAPAGPVVIVPTIYDGADLVDVAERWSLSVDEAVTIHSAIEFDVAFCGFMPGFGYLTGLPPTYHVPRLDTPRPSVPVGSVALAGPYCGVYPRSSPGGWRLIGRTDAALWDAARPEPALFVPGGRVRFEPVRS